MGKNLIQQRRGKGSIFKAKGFASAGVAKAKGKSRYTVLDLIKSVGHSAPLARVQYEDDSRGLLIAAEGLAVGQEYSIGEEASVAYGNILLLKDIPEGTPIFNIESQPGDGGRFVRSSGASAKLVTRGEKAVTVKLPSKRTKSFHPNCKAVVGIVAGGGRVDKPLMKAGKKFHKMRARNKYYPSVSGSAMNAVAHPFGNKRSLRKSKAKPVSRNAPPGRKVGAIAAKRTGRRR